MAAPLVKVFTLLLCINIVLFLGGVRVVGTDNVDFVDNFINTDSYENGTVKASDTYEDTLPESFNQGGSSLLQFIDTMGAVQDFAFFVVNIVFTPLGLFGSLSIPPVLAILIALPIVSMMFFGIIYFIRSGN